MTNINKKINKIVLNSIDIYGLRVDQCIYTSHGIEIRIDDLLDDIYLNIESYFVTERSLIDQHLRFVLAIHERQRKKRINVFKDIK